jgi:hypothetical protein
MRVTDEVQVYWVGDAAVYHIVSAANPKSRRACKRRIPSHEFAIV